MAELCRTRVCAKFRLWPAGGERSDPLLASSPPIRGQSTKFSACGVFKISPSQKSAPFSPSLQLWERNFHRPTTFLRQPIFQRTVDATDLQDACDVCLTPAMNAGIVVQTVLAATSPLKPPGSRSIFCGLSSSSPAGKAFALRVPRHRA